MEINKGNIKIYYPFKNYHSTPYKNIIDNLEYITKNVKNEYLSKIFIKEFVNDKININIENDNNEIIIKTVIKSISATIFIYSYQNYFKKPINNIEKYIEDNNLRIYDTDEIFYLENQLSIKSIVSIFNELNELNENGIKFDGNYYNYVFSYFIKYSLRMNINENFWKMDNNKWIMQKEDSMISIAYFTLFPSCDNNNNNINDIIDLDKLPSLEKVIELGLKIEIRSNCSLIPEIKDNKLIVRRMNFRDGSIKFYWSLLRFEKINKISGNMNGLFNMFSYFIRTNKDFELAKEIGWINEYPEELRFADLFWKLQYSHGYNISSEMYELIKKIEKFYENEKDNLFTEIKILYFKNRKITLATIAAIIIFIITFLGTLFTGIQTYKN